MSLAASRHNLLANLWQQGSGVALFLILPNLLEVREYGYLTVLATIISMSMIADLGFGHIYNRRMPSLVSVGPEEAVRTWNTTTLYFKLFGYTVFGLVAAFYYCAKTGHWNTFFLVILLCLSGVLASFQAAWNVAQSRFSEAKQLSMAQAIGRLLCIPAAAVLGVAGWLIGQIASNLAPLVYRGQRKYVFGVFRDFPRFDRSLIKEHLPEALSLCLISPIWAQFMASGRFYAVLYYPEEIIAQYGLAGALYQIGTALIIAAFVPQTVRLNRLFATDPDAAVNYAFKISAYGTLLVFAGSVISLVLAPWFLHHAFPKYNIPELLIAPLLLSVVNCAVVSVFGTIMMCMGRSWLYLAVLSGSFALTIGMAGILFPWVKYEAAAVAQLIGLTVYSLSLVLIAYQRIGIRLVNKGHFWLSVCIPIFSAALMVAKTLNS